jgi:hypothetical protein
MRKLFGIASTVALFFVWGLSDIEFLSRGLDFAKVYTCLIQGVGMGTVGSWLGNWISDLCRFE